MCFGIFLARQFLQRTETDLFKVFCMKGEETRRLVLDGTSSPRTEMLYRKQMFQIGMLWKYQEQFLSVFGRH